jgi:hypothetical protein
VAVRGVIPRALRTPVAALHLYRHPGRQAAAGPRGVRPGPHSPPTTRSRSIPGSRPANDHLQGAGLCPVVRLGAVSLGGDGWSGLLR